MARNSFNFHRIEITEGLILLSGKTLRLTYTVLKVLFIRLVSDFGCVLLQLFLTADKIKPLFRICKERCQILFSVIHYKLISCVKNIRFAWVGSLLKFAFIYHQYNYIANSFIAGNAF